MRKPPTKKKNAYFKCKTVSSNIFFRKGKLLDRSVTVIYSNIF